MAYTPLVRPMDQQAPAWSYSGGDPNSYRSMLQAMGTTKAKTGLEVDLFNKQQEAEDQYRTEQIAVEREKIGAEKEMFSSELGLRTQQYETAKSQWESEWEKKSREYDLKIEEQEREAELDRRLYSQLTTRIPQLIKSGMWAQI